MKTRISEKKAFIGDSANQERREGDETMGSPVRYFIDLDGIRMFRETEGARYCGLGRTRFRQWCNEIGATRHIGRCVRYDRRVIDRYIDEAGEGKEH